MSACIVVCWKSVWRRSLDKTNNPEITRKMVVLDIFALNKRGYNGIINPTAEPSLKRLEYLSCSLYPPPKKMNELLLTCSFNASKTRLVTFHHRWSDHELPLIKIDGVPLGEAPCIERLLGLKLTPDFKRNSYIWTVAQDEGKMVGSLYL